MFEYVDVGGLDAAGALDVLEQAQQVKRQAEVQEALAMLRVVQAYRHQIGTDKVRLAGDGTGLVDDFACLELAAALHRSVDSVTPQVVELLNLEARLPRLWETVVACGVPVWLGRKLARATSSLTLAKALWLDATIAPFTTRLAPARLLRFVEALVVQADPAAAETRWAQRNTPRVEIGAIQRDGLRDIYGWLTAADATYLNAALNQLADILTSQGSPEPPQARRATALGILATPARALALIQHSLTQPTLTTAPVPDDDRREAAGGGGVLTLRDATAARGTDDGHGPRTPAGCAGHSCGTITVPPDQLLPKTSLVIHLSDDTLTTGTGIGRSEQLGPLTTQQIRELLGHSRVVVRPVFNPNGITGVDNYEIPTRIRRTVLQRHPYEIFPYATHKSTNLDLDHTQPYQWGENRPPGQTRPDNLGPLRRKTHRAKTHAGWQLTQPQPGQFTWTSPLGRRYHITTTGLTNDYQHTPGNNPWDNPTGGPLLPELPTTGTRMRRPRASRRPANRPVRTRPPIRPRPRLRP